MNLPDLSNQKIVFFEVKYWEEEPIKNTFPTSVEVTKELLSEETVERFKDATVVSTFIDSRLNKDVLSKFSNLKFITTRSTGYDHIDINYCNERGIKVANVPSYGSNTVAEHAFMLMLALMKRLPESAQRVKEGHFSPEDLTGSDVQGKVIGVIGTGKIGVNMIQMANGFGMKVLAFDVNQDKNLEESLGFTYVDMDYMLSKADVLSVHVPYIKPTHHLINRDAIAKMKKGVIIINTSRGGIIETDALYDGLRSGQIGGAGLDVVEEEAFVKEEIELLHKDTYGDVDFKIALENHMMAYFPNVIITPHNAFNTHEALQRIIDTSIGNIVGFLNNEPVNILNK